MIININDNEVEIRVMSDTNDFVGKVVVTKEGVFIENLCILGSGSFVKRKIPFYNLVK